MIKQLSCACLGLVVLFWTPGAWADPPLRILLLGQKPDTHPPEAHEYMAGVRLVARMLEQFPSLKVQVVQADSPWPEGPDWQLRPRPCPRAGHWRRRLLQPGRPGPRR